MKLSTQTSIVFPKPREEVFDFCTDDENTARTLRPLGPIAGVARVEMHEGQSLETGAHRTITMTDGVALVEEILDYTRPSRHQYRWVGGIKPPFAWLVRSGTGCWEFSEVSDGTRVVWSYVFELRSPLAYPLALPIISLFKRWMAQGLGAIATEMAQQSTAAPQPPADQAIAQAENG